MTILGDVHGKFEALSAILTQAELTGETVLQLGDLGIGFRGHPHPAKFPEHFYFFDGNHDDLSVCKQFPNYVGEFGCWRDMFLVRGAWSVDWRVRTAGINWWHTEEMTLAQWEECLTAYERVKPEVVVSHDCPLSFYSEVCPASTPFPSRTAQGLQAMFELHQPSLWVFGHHHVSRRFRRGRTQAVALAELETFKV